MGCPVLWDGMPSGISLRYSKTKKVGIYEGDASTTHPAEGVGGCLSPTLAASAIILSADPTPATSWPKVVSRCFLHCVFVTVICWHL